MTDEQPHTTRQMLISGMHASHSGSRELFHELLTIKTQEQHTAEKYEQSTAITSKTITQGAINHKTVVLCIRIQQKLNKNNTEQ